jgi:small conductance mechanosensitive channel
MLDVNTQTIAENVRPLIPLIVTNGLNAVGAVAILLAGLWLSGKVHQIVVRMMERAPRVDAMLKGFFSSLARYVVLTVTALAVLSQFGIQTASLVTVIGAAGLAIGLALQGTLSNLAAGVMLLIFRPFKIKDDVQVSGTLGTVKDLSLLWTELVTSDKVQVIIPNSGVWGQPIRNFSTYPKPPAAGEARFRVAEVTDLDKAEADIRAIIEADSRILKDPGPTIFFDRTAAENALEIVVKFSTTSWPDPIKSDLIRSVHRLFNPRG